MRNHEIEFGWVYVAPGRREKYHCTRECPEVVAGYKLLEPGDGGYSHLISVLEECEWCRKFRYHLVSPIR